MTVIITNNTHTKLVGRVVTKEGYIIKNVAIEANKSVSVPIKEIKNKRVFFVPLIPAFQDVELILGKKSYEIPPKR